MANDRISQLPVEVVVLPTSQKARTSQLPAEVIYQPTTATARNSQLLVEVIVQNETIRRPMPSAAIGWLGQ